MMLRYAAVRPDGSIARILTASDEAAIDANMPAGTAKVSAPDGVMFGSHAFDFQSEAFTPIAQPATQPPA